MLFVDISPLGISKSTLAVSLCFSFQPRGPIFKQHVRTLRIGHVPSFRQPSRSVVYTISARARNPEAGRSTRSHDCCGSYKLSNNRIETLKSCYTQCNRPYKYDHTGRNQMKKGHLVFPESLENQADSASSCICFHMHQRRPSYDCGTLTVECVRQVARCAVLERKVWIVETPTVLVRQEDYRSKYTDFTVMYDDIPSDGRKY